MRFDTHVHLCDTKFDIDRVTVLQQADAYLECATSLIDAPAVLALAESNSRVYGAVGIHPMACPKKADIPAALQELSKLVKHPRCSAIGEIGLDFRPGQPERAWQIDLFAAQLELAHANGKPTSIHCVHAVGALSDVLKSTSAGGGFIHGFSMAKEMARFFIDKGYLLGIGAAATYDNNYRLKDLLTYIPLDKLVLETDSPFMPPQPCRGQRNAPANLQYVAQVIAACKEISVEEVYRVTYSNACSILRIPG